MDEKQEDFGAGVLEELIAGIGGGKRSVPAPSADPGDEEPIAPQSTPKSEWFDFSELESEAEKAVGAPPPDGKDEQPSGERASTEQESTERDAVPEKPSAPQIDDALLARAAQIGVPITDVMSWTPENFAANLARAETYIAFNANYRRQAEAASQQAKAQERPAFDEEGLRKQLTEKNYEDDLVEQLVQRAKAEHDLKGELAGLKQSLQQQMQFHAQQNAANAFAEWNRNIEAGIAELDESVKSVVTKDKIAAVQSRSLALAQAYQASGQPIPDAKTLAQESAFALFGPQIIQAAKSGPMSKETYAKGVTARPRQAKGPAVEGERAAVAALARSEGFKKLERLWNN